MFLSRRFTDKPGMLGAQARVALEALQAQVGRGGGEGRAHATSRLAMHVSLLLATLCALWFMKHEAVASVSRKIVSSVVFPVRALQRSAVSAICCCRASAVC